MRRLLALFSLLLIGLPTVTAEDSHTVNHLTMNQWVRAVDSQLAGRVVLPMAGGQSKAVSGATVALMNRSGKVLHGKTNQRGEFSIDGIEPGVYALTARANNVFACCAMHVIADSKNSRFPQSAEISVANVDYTTVNTAVIRYLPPNVKNTNVSLDNVDLSQIAPRVCGEDLFRVVQFAGGMKGHLHLAGAVGSSLAGAKDTNVFIVDKGIEVARAITDSNGQFLIPKLDPGHYSLLAVGPGGVGLIGFELVDEAEFTTASVGKTNIHSNARRWRLLQRIRHSDGPHA